jgi:hypothetical protein
MNNYWLKQTTEAPLYENLLWSRPENKIHAGKVLVIGGNKNGFSKTVNSYQGLLNAGAGSITVLLPKTVKKVLGHISPDVIYCPDTDSGSFGPESYGDMVEYSSGIDGTFMPGELSNNSQTLVVIEKFISGTNKPLIASEDNLDLMLQLNNELLNRTNMIFIAQIDKLQKLLTKLKATQALTSNIALVNLVEVLHNFTSGKRLSIVTIHDGYVIVAKEGIVSSTKIDVLKDLTVFKLANYCTCWVAQNPDSIFEALSCAAVSFQ